MPKDNTSLNTQMRQVDSALEQYRYVVSRVNYLFDIISAKVGAKWHEDGIGTCTDSPEDFGERDRLRGDLSDELHLIWAWKLVVNAADSQADKCQYHITGRGCALGDTKPPVCVMYVEQSDGELYGLIGMSRNALKGFLRRAMERVVDGADQSLIDDDLQRLEEVIKVAENCRFERRFKIN